MNIFNIYKQPGDDNDLQEVDFIEKLVYDQFETTSSETEFNESKDSQMIYFQEEIKDKKGTENVVADSLSRLTIDSTSDITSINDYFSDEYLFSIITMS
jgi:glutaredoxin 2